MHEVVFSDARQKKNGVNTMDIAKRLIDYGFHPYTTAFPLIVPGAMMIEPTESESKEECDLFIDAMRSIAEEAAANPELVKDRAALHARRPPRRSRRRAQADSALETVAAIQIEAEFDSRWLRQVLKRSGARRQVLLPRAPQYHKHCRQRRITSFRSWPFPQAKLL